MIREKSCGTLVFKDDKVLMIRHNVGHWSFPKGHVEKGETDNYTLIETNHSNTDAIDEFIESNENVKVYTLDK